MAGNRDHFAYYIVKNSNGMCGKVSNNPTEQNCASVVSFVGETIYVDPAFQIKTLLACQHMLEKKRLVYKSSQQLSLGIAVALLMKEDIDNNVVEATKTVEKSYNPWKQQHELSSSYNVELDKDHQMRIFRHRDSPNIP